jgi:hypothetical protein
VTVSMPPQIIMIMIIITIIMIIKIMCKDENKEIEKYQVNVNKKEVHFPNSEAKSIIRNK